MQTINYLNENSLAFLIREFSISVNEWLDKDGQILYVLNYNQIDSPKNHPITNECRSLVVTYEEDEWVVVSRSFDRFFNYGETQDFYDITKMIAYEKVDGSIVSLFHWKGECPKREVIFVSGRDAVCQSETRQWLIDNLGEWTESCWLLINQAKTVDVNDFGNFDLSENWDAEIENIANATVEHFSLSSVA